MGDVGNDIKIYGSKMYVVVNASIKLKYWIPELQKNKKSITVENGRY